MHRLPIINNTRVASRFLIPTAFALAMLASVTLDEVVRRIGARRFRNDGTGDHSPRSLLEMGMVLLVFFALGDSFLVGRHALEGAFPAPPVAITSRSPSIITVRKAEGSAMGAVLANYCVTSASEALPIPVMVTPREDARLSRRALFR